MSIKNKQGKNPIVDGWYADPEARFYEGRYWIYVTRSDTDYYKQMNLDAFSSVDLKTWDKYESILQMEEFPWITNAVWAPTIIDKDGKYYLIFASNDIKNNEQEGGLAIAVADTPQGPFHNLLSAPLINRFINGAQPIDAHLFKDIDGTIYLYYGGWRHCNIAIFNKTMDGFLPFNDNEFFHEITPEGYVEGPCMLYRNGYYYFMWSEGDWMDGSYRVCYSRSKTPTEFKEAKKTLLESDNVIANGPGHHGFINIPDTDDWLIVYHRRIIGDNEPGHRILCIDKLLFNANDDIEKIVMT